MKGKQRCKILKEIRKEIAQNNDIEYVVSECKHQGDCAGTCPKCEAEVRYLERELEKRQRAGKTIVLAGITAATITASVGCLDSNIEEPGNLVPPDSQTVNTYIDGEVLPDSESSGIADSIELMGDMVMYLKRVENISAYQTDQSEKNGLPELSRLLSMEEGQILNALAGFRRNDVLSAWKDSITDTDLGNGDRFLLPEAYIDIYYNADGYIDILEIIS